jgi:hypothetical protein
MDYEAILRLKIKELKKAFRKKLAEIPNEELEKIDNWFNDCEEILMSFYGIEKFIRYKWQRTRFLDFLYMFSIAFNKFEYDGRYDQPIFFRAFQYAGIKTEDP